MWCRVTGWALAFALLGALGQVLAASSASSLKVSLLIISRAQLAAYQAQIDRFKLTYPEMKVDVDFIENESYKKHFVASLTGKPAPDVMFAFAGHAISNAARAGQLVPLDQVLSTTAWQATFNQAIRTAVNVDGKHYALPLHYYQWGMYYNKSVFRELHLVPPKNWAELLTWCHTAREQGIEPILVGGREGWPLAGWFDYLDLRINGLAFHLQLMRGEVPFTDARVRQVFEHWQRLFNRECFNDDMAQRGWRDVLSRLYRAKAGLMLMGNFWTSQIPPALRNQIGFIPFPHVVDKLPLYEDAPLDVLIMPANGANRTEAELFLRFMARADIQATISQSVGMLPGHVDAAIGDDMFLVAGRQLLNRAEGSAQFLDRDTPPGFAALAIDAFLQFVRRPAEIDPIVQQLESARRQYLQKQ
ncbi:ABC transporter substrate-binding protein [Chitinivorax sp. B]|uniref:ABC transporter substrate-binding protein n=1 Tax=Chitinivorax sp. B TaxID=2502235 RepID=UPI0010F9DEE9|nr:ABC transporter substrate-binding protein [Chitinivorax sp. B]